MTSDKGRTDKNTEQETPDTDKEDDNHDDHRPLGNIGRLPQELPVSTATPLALVTHQNHKGGRTKVQRASSLARHQRSRTRSPTFA